MVLRERNNSSAISGNDRWVESIGRRRSSAPVSADAPGSPGSRSFASRAKRLGLVGQVSEVRPTPEQFIDLPHERPGPCHVGQREVDANQLNPGLNGEVGQGIGQQVPQPLSADEFLAGGQDISPVDGCAGLHRADKGYCVAFFDPGPAQYGACLFRQAPRPGPIRCVLSPPAIVRTARARHPRARRLVPDADSIRQGRVAAIDVTAKDARDPLQERGCRRHEALRREPAHRLVCVSAHLFDPAPARKVRSTAAHASVEGSPGRARSPYCQRSTTSAHRSASTGRPVNAQKSAASTATIGAPRTRPDPSATEATA